MRSDLTLVKKLLVKAAKEWKLEYPDWTEDCDDPSLREYVQDHVCGVVHRCYEGTLVCCTACKREGAKILKIEVGGLEFTYSVWRQEPKDRNKNHLLYTKIRGPSSNHYGVTSGGHDMVSFLNNKDMQQEHASAERRGRRREDGERR